MKTLPSQSPHICGEGRHSINHLPGSFKGGWGLIKARIREPHREKRPSEGGDLLGYDPKAEEVFMPPKWRGKSVMQRTQLGQRPWGGWNLFFVRIWETKCGQKEVLQGKREEKRRLKRWAGTKHAECGQPPWRMWSSSWENRQRAADRGVSGPHLHLRKALYENRLGRDLCGIRKTT